MNKSLLIDLLAALPDSVALLPEWDIAVHPSTNLGADRPATEVSFRLSIEGAGPGLAKYFEDHFDSLPGRKTRSEAPPREDCFEVSPAMR